MKRNRKSLKKRSGRTLLALLLAAALTVGGMTTALATEEDPGADAAVTEESAATDAENVEAVSDESGETATYSAAEHAVAEGDASDLTNNSTGTDDPSADDAQDITEDPGYDPAYGLYGGYDGQDSMDDPEKAGACVGWDVATMSAITADSGLWWIDDYYVDESDSYYVEETNDFTLKYQVEFHASEDLAAESVEILIEASLGTYRDGTNILPTELGIPYGYPDNYTESSASPFNYYYVDEDGNMLTESEAQTYTGTVYLKIWNYREIASGSNAMFQVLYKSMDIMQIKDESTWDLEVKATVDIPVYDEDGEPTGETTPEGVDGNTLSGHVNTYATLTSVTKKAYNSASVSYTPGLYSKTQISKYISGSLPEEYEENFDDYIYIVWQVSASGTANQAWTLTTDSDATYITVDGETVLEGAIVGTSASTSSSSTTSHSISKSYYVVTAYSKEEYEALVEMYGQDNVIAENDVTMTVHPQDGYDEDTTKSASATTTWSEYEWHYAGDTIGISKSGGGTFYAYLLLYKQNAEKGIDTGAFSFSTSSTCRGYSMTHYTTNENGNMGEYIPGTYYTVTTVDDVLYAYPNSQTSPSRMLTKDDYYFSSVTVKSSDTGYDVWEDTTAGAETVEDVDQNLYLYAMFYDADEQAMDEDGWEYVGMVEWNSSGSMTYTFSDEELARQPYRVKAVHSSVNYSTSCTISLGVMLRGDSEILNGFYDTYGDDLDSIRIENISGVAGQTEDGTYFQDTSIENGNYSEKDTVTGETLAEFTEDLYDTILQRDNAYATLYGLTTHAAATKSVSTENDVANGRVLANYTLTAYESYRVTGSSTVDALRELGISLPARNDVTYYDLLPYGMKFNANATVTAGRITTMSGSWTTNARAWDTTGVTVTVGEEDVITNWNGTGRTMVIFHIHYDGDDASAYYNNLWFEGYGISFQAYYDWSDMDAVDAEYNIAAYVAENVEDESQQLLGEEDSSIWKDDGSASLGSQYAPFMGYEDLNGDGITDLYTNMYCSATTSTNVATANTDSIKKTVRADADAVAEYGSTAVVANGGTYTYEISLTNGTGASLSDIVIFDRLEDAVEDERVGVEEETNPDSVFAGLTSDQIANHWTGTLISVTTTALADIGINAVVYYNADREAKVSGEDGSPTPTEVLTADNGWYTEDEFISIYGSLSEAKAVAVDISTTTSGSSFYLLPGESLSFQIHMQAPEEVEDGYMYAFNNPMYYSVADAGEWTSATDSGDTVRVEIGEAGTLEVEKEFADADSVPGSMASQRFTFQITRTIYRTPEEGDPYTEVEILAGREYMVYNWDEEKQEWVSSGVISSTDAKGQFTLRAGQKAVFSNIVDVENVVITEVESVLWDAKEDVDDSNLDDLELYVTYTNAYRSPVYLYKTVMTTDLATDEELADARFTFQLLVDTDGDGVYEPYANGEYLYVKEVLTDGSSPSLDTSKGEAGHGYADENGYVTLGIDDIIVFFPCDEDGNYIDVPYQIVEVTSGEEWNDDWVNMDDTAGGTTGVYGTSETITNYYKYRNLILTKDLSDYDHDFDTCEDEWTFRLTDENGDPVTGNHWYMIDADGNPVYTIVEGDEVPVEGYLDDNGEFSFTGAGSGRRIVIEGLVMGETYVLTETDYDAELYEQVNDGTVDTTMPTYGITRSITITNKYLMKDLSVEKLVLTDTVTDEAHSHEFTFTLEKLVDGVYVPVPGATYTVDGVEYTTDENGQFTLKHGETAYFDDLGYQGDEYRVTETPDATYGQIYPANNGSNDATLQSDGVTVRFINGNFDQVASLTKELVGLDDVGAAYADIVKGENTAATLVDGEDAVPYTVEVTFGVYGESGACVTEDAGVLIDYEGYNEDYPYVYIKIEADGTYTLRSYNGGVMTETLNPYDYIYIAAIGDCTVKASEDDGMARVILDVTSDVSGVIGSDQILSEGDVMSGSAAANENIVLVNNISSANKASEIYKLMTEASDGVPAGSQITFIVEVYDEATDTWSPASGIKYITMDGYSGEGKTDDGVTYHDTSDCWATSGVLTTGSDGKITLTKTDGGYPYIRFIEDVVYANVYEDMEDGTLRIVETSSGTDDVWGLLVGYDAEGWVGGPSLNIQYADTFYNGNDESMKFEVEKEMADDTECDDDFTFYLRQIISASSSPITSMDEILESEVGAGITYVIYDVETGVRVGEGVTDANGAFTLKPGQYAVFYVPDDTSWYVYEGVNPGYPLDSVEANDDAENPGDWGYSNQASIVDETNGMVQNTHSVYATGTIILTLTDSETGEPLAGGVFDLYKDGTLIQSALTTDANGQIIVTGCTPGEYYFEETEAPSGYKIPDTATTDTVTVEAGLTQVKEYPISMENEENVTAVKYAVRIYGICADDYSLDGGDTTESVKASLTFGPATGASYLDSYVSCASDTCIHKLSWDEITTLCEQNKGDENALRSLFGSCLENGCTTSVKLNLNDTIGTGTTYNWSGDGTGELTGNTVNNTYRYWNYTNSTTGYYPASRVRATLNGADSYTNSSVAGTDTLDADTCLFSCFPASLQSAIVPKVVGSGSGYTTYDRLWLFSQNELWGYTSTDEGSQYEYLSQKGVTTSSYSLLANYQETGSTNGWWSRSRNGSSYAYNVSTAGSRNYTYAYSTYGLAPGFCIE